MDRTFSFRSLPGFNLAPYTLAAALFLSYACFAGKPSDSRWDTLDLSHSDENLADYFELETARISDRCLADIHTLADWTARKETYRRQLQDMLGLWPLPPRTDLHPVITGKLDQDDFVVEKLHFQAMPGLYVTANLYLPKSLPQPAPAILYVCGHSHVVTNGVSCGNKTGYQHHGAWFARNGYVCLLIDTVQLGEIEGVHHGTYRLGQWWWNSRGYTPAGVEAWFGIRALDYLCSRPEVDPQRIGMTGRSGGGSYTWTVAALDDRVKVAAPVAGMTDLRNQVVDGAIDGHCDCMFFLNSYRWDFPLVAALIAPRPLLIGNSDKDTLFPLDGVIRIYNQARRLYRLYGATNNIGLLITEGPHADTQDLQVPVFRWFNRFLKDESPLIEMAAKKYFPPEQLRVFDTLPKDEINTTIQERFGGPWPGRPLWSNDTPEEGSLRVLQSRVFGGWPDTEPAFQPTRFVHADQDGLLLDVYPLETQPDVSLNLIVLRERKIKKPSSVTLEILDTQSWTNSPACCLWTAGVSRADLELLRQRMQQQKTALAFFAPRGVVPSRWTTNATRLTQIRRRYMLLGQTLDGMRVWDIRCAVQAVKSLPEFGKAPLCVRAKDTMGINAAYAALFQPEVQHLDLEALPVSHREGPDYLNVLKYCDIPQVLDHLRARLGPPSQLLGK